MGPQIEKAQCAIKNIKNPEKLVDICLRKKLRSKTIYDLISVRELRILFLVQILHIYFKKQNQMVYYIEAKSNVRGHLKDMNKKLIKHVNK